MPRKAPRTIYKLDFSDTPYGKADEDGDPLEISMTGLSFGESLNTMELEATFREAATSPEKAVRAARDIVTTLAPHIVEWNLTDHTGARIDPSLPALMSQDPMFLFGIVKAWRTAVMAVAPGLPQTSTDGGRSVEASLPMDTTSGSPGNSPEPSSSSPPANDSVASPPSS